jgi:hypothetical protein
MATRFFRHNPSDPYATLPSTRSLMGYESGVGSWTSGFGGELEDTVKTLEGWGMKAYDIYQLQEQLRQVNKIRSSQGQFPLTAVQLKQMMDKGIDPTYKAPAGGGGGGGVPAPAAAGGGMMAALLPLALMMMMGKR